MIMTNDNQDNLSSAFEINKTFWNSVSKNHLNSELYDVDGFLGGKSSLNDIELPLLQAVAGKSVLHVQCHFGMDTISIGRLGAKQVVGTDFSEEAIEIARELAEKDGSAATFVVANTNTLTDHIDQTFDFVFMSYGALVWLPDLGHLADQLNAVTHPGSTVMITEFHPTLYMFDHPKNTIGYDYFNTHMYKEVEEGSYASDDDKTMYEQCFWSHALAEIFEAFKSRQFDLEVFEEYPYSPYKCFDNMVEVEKNKYAYRLNDVIIPHVYTMQWVKA